MKKIIFFSFLLVSSVSFAQVNNAIEFDGQRSAESMKDIIRSFNFNYYVKYLGPSLGSGHKSGETFDRFNSGQNYTGGDIEPNGAFEVYQSFRLSYTFSNNSALSYGVTFQEDLHNAEAKTYDPKGNKLQNNTYNKGYSDNNHRLSYWSSLYSNSLFFLSATLYYEMPTTKSSQDSGMEYGAGIQPTIGFYTPNPYIMTGLNFSFERDFYKENQKSVYFDNGMKSDYDQKYQVARVTINPYLNYALTEKTTLKSSLLFDWDQQGNQANTTKFNRNMVDIMALGVGYRFTKNVSGDFFVEAALEEMSLNRSATGLALTLNI